MCENCEFAFCPGKRALGAPYLGPGQKLVWKSRSHTRPEGRPLQKRIGVGCFPTQAKTRLEWATQTFLTEVQDHGRRRRSPTYARAWLTYNQTRRGLHPFLKKRIFLCGLELWLSSRCALVLYRTSDGDNRLGREST